MELNKIIKEKENIYRQLGERYLQKHIEQVQKEEPDLVEKLEGLNSSIRKHHMQQVKEKGCMLCPRCDAEIKLDSFFCNYCGVKIQENDKIFYQTLEKEVSMKKEQVCRNCGEKIEEEGQKYCTNCGMKLK